MLIAGDIGGTKSLLALVSGPCGPRQPLAEQEFRSAEFPGLAPMVRTFLARAPEVEVRHAAFALPGPVLEGRCKLSNLDWVVEAEEVRRLLELERVVLLNDIEAIAGALPYLEPEELQPLQAGEPRPRGPLAVIAPGTGLGEGFAVWSGSRYVAGASEGGHANFGPASQLELELLEFLMQRQRPVEWEHVCSGLGIPNLYDFLRRRQAGGDSPAFELRLAEAEDRAPLIVDAAVRDPAGHPLCAAALELFVDLLGNEAGNLGLKVLATGGVYLGGGIPPRIVTQLTDGRFLRAFRDKGRFAGLMATLPVHVILTRAALLGAAMRGLEDLAITGGS